VSHCPTISLPCQIHVTLFYCVPLSHCITAMTNTCHSLLLCPTVPSSHHDNKYMSLSFNVSHCPTISLPYKYMSLSFTVSHYPTISLPCQIHVTLFYCVPLSHCITAMTNTCHSLLLCPTVPSSHHDNKYMPLTCIVSICPTCALSIASMQSWTKKKN
jgi:hypothetical protein